MRSRRQPEPWAAKLGTSSLDPLQAMDLQEAIRTRKKTALVQGQKFLLTYYKVGTEDKVYYRPESDEYVPSGHLDIKRFLEDF